jgi:hypothetical protein
MADLFSYHHHQLRYNPCRVLASAICLVKLAICYSLDLLEVNQLIRVNTLNNQIFWKKYNKWFGLDWSGPQHDPIWYCVSQHVLSTRKLRVKKCKTNKSTYTGACYYKIAVRKPLRGLLCRSVLLQLRGLGEATSTAQLKRSTHRG